MKAINCTVIFFFYSLTLLAISIFIYLTKFHEVPNCPKDGSIALQQQQQQQQQSAGTNNDSKRRYNPSEICKPGKTSDCVPPFHYFVDKFRIAPESKLVYCAIEKIMSTFMSGVICYLYKPDQFIAANRSLYTEYYQNRFCMDENEEEFLNAALKRVKKGKGGNANMLAVVRDPLDRFISAFVNKCVVENKDILMDTSKHCYDCGNNISCFVNRQYQRALGYVKGRIPGIGYEDIHTYPQTWHCNFQKMFENYTIIRYASRGEDKTHMNRQILEALRNFGVPQGRRSYISSQMSKHSLHQTATNPERTKYEAILLNDKKAMKKFLKLYYYDYVLFGFDLPYVTFNED